ncbi:MAG: LuxR family transcriptional regulator [Nitrospirota bacterium]
MARYPINPELITLLSKQDAVFLLDLTHKCLSCNTKEELKGLILRLKHLISHDYALIGFAAVGEEGMKDGFDIVNVSYPDEWLALYVSDQLHRIDPVPRHNFTKFDGQYWKDTYKIYNTPKEFISKAADFGLVSGYTFGARDLRGTHGSLLSVSGRNMKRDRRTELILELVTPHFHQCFERIVRAKYATSPPSPREKEVLKWIGQGKSTWEVAMILGISERTVKFHLQNVMRKLNAVSRPHAIALGLELGIIDL